MGQAQSLSQLSKFEMSGGLCVEASVFLGSQWLVIRQNLVVCRLSLCCLTIKGNLLSDRGQPGHCMSDWPTRHTKCSCVYVCACICVCLSVCPNLLTACLDAEPAECGFSYPPIEWLCYVPGECVCLFKRGNQYAVTQYDVLTQALLFIFCCVLPSSTRMHLNK